MVVSLPSTVMSIKSALQDYPPASQRHPECQCSLALLSGERRPHSGEGFTWCVPRMRLNTILQGDLSTPFHQRHGTLDFMAVLYYARNDREAGRTWR